MAISQSVMDSMAASFMMSVLPKAPLEVAMGQVVAVQAKSSGVGLATEKGVELINAGVVVGEAQRAGTLSAGLVTSSEKMVTALMEATANLGKQASDMKVPK